MLEIGSIVDGKYKILNKIGQGGMSVVYLAINERANKTWAIKEVRKDGVQNFEVVKQGLIAETDILKRLNHSHLPSIVDVIDADDTFLIVMDYVEGKPLSDLLKEYGPQPQETVIEWGKQLCDVLAYLHSRKPPIIYRDMKPSNVMLKEDNTPYGTVMLIDFGTAREFKGTNVEDTKCLGTQGYAAPEQYGGHGETDARTDIYNLGATMYHLVTGHNPSQPPYEMYPIRRWNPGLSSGLEEIIEKCTRKNPADRYQNCSELMYALEHYDQLDIEYRKAQKKKWVSFLVTASLAAAAGIAAAGFRFAENRMTASTYDAYLEEAEASQSINAEECVENYKEAIKLDPSRSDAYEAMLSYYTNMLSNGDDAENELPEFSTEESEAIREVLGRSGNNRLSNEELMRRGNEDDYHKFAYELGIAYYYLYEGVGDKAASKKWLGIAREAQVTEDFKERDRERAEKLYNIANYYDNLNIRNQAGDEATDSDYADFWEDLDDLVAFEDENLANNRRRLQAYKEMTGQIQTNALKFSDAGITKDEMLNKLQEISRSLSEMNVDEESGEDNSLDLQLKETVQENIRLAETKLKSLGQ